MPVAVSVRVDVQLSPGVWTDITTDVVAAKGLRFKYGIEGNRPVDCVASTGQLEFTLRNDAGNSGGVLGYYSPAHANKRTGWMYGIPVRVVFGYDAGSMQVVNRNQGLLLALSCRVPASGTVDYTKFYGTIEAIDPYPGVLLDRQVQVLAYDGMAALMEADARAVTLQIDQTEAELLTEILDSLEPTTQPVARAIDTGVDTYPFAFDNLGQGVKAGSLIQDVTLSAYGMSFVRGDGTFVYRNRHTRAIGASAFSFNNTMTGLAVPSSLENIYNRVRVTIHPKAISSTPTDELYTLPTGTHIEIGSSVTREVWTEYSDPNDRQTRVGGTAVVTTLTLIAGTHYSANSASDGSGTDLTPFITAAIDPFSATAKWTLTNTSAQLAYIRVLRVVGKAVRDPGPQTFEAFTTTTQRDRPISFDMPYQDDARIGESAATFVQAQYRSIDHMVDSIEFFANQSDALMLQALQREPGDIVTITETVTGASAVNAVIHSVEFDVLASEHVLCRWGLAPASPFETWQFGITGRAEFDETTVLGF